MTFNADDLVLALPEVFLACFGMALLLYGAYRRRNALAEVSALAVIGLIIAGVMVLTTDGARATAFNGLYVADSFTNFMKILVLLGAAAGVIMSRGYMRAEKMSHFEFPVLIIFATLGMLMMVSANDLISLYIGLEVQSLSLYVLAAFRRDTVRSAEAGLKYFVLGALSSGMLLYGSSMIYGFTGATSFEALAIYLVPADGGPSLGVIVGLVFLSAGLAFKVSAAPFHMWTPDVYEGAPTPVTAFFSVAPKIAAVALFIRVMVGPLGDLAAQWQQIVIAIAVSSMALGSLAAIAQRNIKRLMAYSSIGHVGYALVGLAAATPEGVRGVIIYMAIYLVMNVGCFACILCMREKGRAVEGIDDLAGLAKTNPPMAFAMALFMFSMAGIPPLAGFFGKLYIFLAAIDAGLYTLAVIGVLTSVVGAFYYLRIVKLMYFDQPETQIDRSIGKTMAAVMLVTAVLVTVFFIAPGPLVNTAEVAAQTLY